MIQFKGHIIEIRFNFLANESEYLVENEKGQKLWWLESDLEKVIQA